MKRLDFLILSYLLLQSVPSAAGNINVSVPKASKPVLSVLQKNLIIRMVHRISMHIPLD